MTRTSDALLCLSHVRWDRANQRPHALMQRCARDRRVVYFEDPRYDVAEAELELRGAGQVIVATPHLVRGTAPDDAQRSLKLMAQHVVDRAFTAPPVLWYYTPSALTFTRDILARAVVYDCVDPGILRGAPLLDVNAQALLRRADVVFTRERGLWQHPFAYAPDDATDDAWQTMWTQVERAVSRRSATVARPGRSLGSAGATARAARRDD